MSQLTDTYQEFCREGITDMTNWEKFNHFELTYHSTAIEGSTLSKKEAYNLLAHGTKPKNKPIEHTNMVLDHYEALQFVLQQAKARAPIDENLIRSIGAKVNNRTRGITHTVLGSWDDSKGEYRLTSVHAGGHYFPSYDKVPKKMQAFVLGTNEDVDKAKGIEEVYKLAFAAHYHMVSIHPFGDGNGRTSRLLMNYIQAYHKKPLTLVFYKDKEEYIDSLKRSRQENSEAMQNFMKSQAIKYFQKWLLALEEAKNRKYDFSFSK